jgi:uncharacterized membrane protein AbrB (regulator of aidB expression)
MPATPRKGRRFGGSSQHQRLMMANLVASLVAAEGIVTTEAKAKALRPVPGGQAEMVMIAIVAGSDVAFVVTHHLLRIVTVILAAPIVARWVMRRGK